MSEPLSGRFSVVCRAKAGKKGFLQALRDCPDGGSVLLLEGVYRLKRTLLVDRSVHIFVRGRAELRGLMPRDSEIIRVRGAARPSATFDRLRIENQTEVFSCTLRIDSGHLRLQGGDFHSRIQNPCAALVAVGASTRADVLGCAFRGGGGNGIAFVNGACGRIEGCDVRGNGAESGIYLTDAGTSSRLPQHDPRLREGGVRLRRRGPSLVPGRGQRL